MLNVINEKETLNLLDSVKYGVQGIKVLLDQKPALQGNLVEVENDIKAINSKLEFIATTKSYYVKAVDILYEESVGALKETLNAALKYIMFDKNYACNLILDDKRGTKTLEVTLVDLDDDFEVDLKDGVGQGVRTIISFILKAGKQVAEATAGAVSDAAYSS